MDPVNAKALKGKHKDRKDKDIDNDGDVDDSDEYLHKRRKAVSKAIDNTEKQETVSEAATPQMMKCAKELEAYAKKHGGIDKADFMKAAKMLDQIGRVNILQAGQLLSQLNRFVDGLDTDVRERIYVELKKVGLVESVQEAKVECPKCKGEGCDHCDGKGYHMTEAKQKNWMVTVTKPINKLKKGMQVVVPARNTAEAIKKALKKMGENPAAIGSGHLDVKLDEGLEEAKFTPKEIKMAIGIASDPRYKGGNMTGATKAIDKIKKGLSDYPQVAAVLKRQNESVDLEEKLQVSDGMKKWIEDFQKSDASQFEGMDKNERREIAIAAYLAAKRREKGETNESSKAYGKSMQKKMDDKKKANISSKDKETLGKLAAMMAKEKGKK